MKLSKIIWLSLVLCLRPGARGEVVLQDSYAAGSAGGAPTDLGGGVFGYEFNLDPETEFSAAGHGKLVMVYSGHDGNVGGVPTVTSVTYDGVALTEAVQDSDNGGIVTAGIFYLDDVASDGTLRIELASDTTVHYGFGLYAVDGLKAGVQDTGSGRLDSEFSTTAPVTMTTDSGFFVQEYTRNNQAVGDIADEYQLLYEYSVDSYRGISQYRLTTAAGDYFAPGNYGGENFRRIVTAAFEGVAGATTVPEITSINPLGSNVFELTLTGEAGTSYEFYSSTTLDFSPGTLVENLTQGDPGDAGTIGGTNNSVLTTDGNGDGTVRVTLTGSPADFVRAQTTP